MCIFFIKLQQVNLHMQNITVTSLTVYSVRTLYMPNLVEQNYRPGMYCVALFSVYFTFSNHSSSYHTLSTGMAVTEKIRSCSATAVCLCSSFISEPARPKSVWLVTVTVSDESVLSFFVYKLSNHWNMWSISPTLWFRQQNQDSFLWLLYFYKSWDRYCWSLWFWHIQKIQILQL